MPFSVLSSFWKILEARHSEGWWGFRFELWLELEVELLDAQGVGMDANVRMVAKIAKNRLSINARILGRIDSV